MDEQFGDLKASIQETIDGDAEFQSSLSELSDEDKGIKISEKKDELLTANYSSLKEKADKAEELANNYKIRAEKAEKGKKTDSDKGDTTPTKEGDDLSSKDLYVLMENKIPQEDVDEVIKSSKLLGKTIAESLKDPVVQGILKTRQEHRATAETTNTGKARVGTKSVSGQELLDNLSKGIVPEPGSKEAEVLFWERRGGKPK